MNINEYISSGIVESYVLGLADTHEQAEFEQMCALHPEVREAREKFEIALESEGRRNEVQPPAGLKSKIFSSIEMEAGPGESPSFGVGSGLPPVKDISYGSGDDIDGRSNMGVRRMPVNFQKLIAAAAVILLVLSTALNFYFFNRYQEYNDRYQALLASQSELAQHNQVLQTRMLDYEKAIDMMKDPGMAVIKMPAIPTSPDPTSATVVYWDTATKDVYLAVNKLPAPAADQQYQLWALVDGKPVDAGVFEMNAQVGIMKMKNIPKAEAFAITLERKGGSPTPTMDKLYVLGKV